MTKDELVEILLEIMSHENKRLDNSELILDDVHAVLVAEKETETDKYLGIIRKVFTAQKGKGY